MTIDGVSEANAQQQSNSEDSVPAPGFVPQVLELMVLAKFWVKESLPMYWRAYLDCEPVNAEREDAIWVRLAALLDALGGVRFYGALQQGCREFFAELHIVAVDDEIRRCLITIFLSGDNGQRGNAALLVGRYQEDGNRGYRDRRLKEIVQRVQHRNQNEIPREIRLQLDRIRQFGPRS